MSHKVNKAKQISVRPSAGSPTEQGSIGYAFEKLHGLDPNRDNWWRNRLEQDRAAASTAAELTEAAAKQTVLELEQETKTGRWSSLRALFERTLSQVRS